MCSSGDSRRKSVSLLFFQVLEAAYNPWFMAPPPTSKSSVASLNLSLSLTDSPASTYNHLVITTGPDNTGSSSHLKNP